MKRFLILLAAVILLFGCEGMREDLYMKGSVFSTTESSQGAGENEPTPTPEAEAEAPIEITISAVGDVLSHGYNTKAAKTADGYDYYPQFSEMKDAFRGDDFTIANLESMNAGKEFGYTGYPTFNAPENLSLTLKKIGVDAVSTANNHSVDKGSKAVPRNLENVRANGLIAYGTNASEEERNTPTIVDIKGIKTGLLSYTYGTNGIPVKIPYQVNLIDKTAIAADIKRTREAGAELIIVSMHWGIEYTDKPVAEQKDLAAFLEEQGVDIVLGSHPHVLEPIELRDTTFEGQPKKMAMIYSLGNFYSGQTQPKTRTGVVFRVKVSKVDGKVSVQNTSYELTYCNSWVQSNGLTMYQVLPLNDPERYQDKDRYADMKKEFERANELLNSKVKYE